MFSFNKWFQSTQPLERATPLLSEVAQVGDVRVKQGGTTSPRLRQCGHVQQRICLSPTSGSREELSQPVNMRAQQADHLQRGACRGQHQLHPGHCQQVLMGECFPLDVQHPMEANKDLVAENTGGEVLTNLPTETTRHISTVLAKCTPWCNNSFRQIFNTMEQRR